MRTDLPAVHGTCATCHTNGSSPARACTECHNIGNMENTWNYRMD